MYMHIYPEKQENRNSESPSGYVIQPLKTRVIRCFAIESSLRFKPNMELSLGLRLWFKL